MSKKPGFMIYNDWENLMMQLSAPALKELLQAMFDYNRTAEPPRISNRNAQMAWNMIQGKMDHDTERYEKRVAQCRDAINARWGKGRSADDGGEGGEKADEDAPAEKRERRKQDERREAKEPKCNVNKYMNW